MPRNYKKEYKNYQGTTTQKKRRASRNTARNRALAKGTVKKGDNKDIDHKDGNPRNNKKSNLRAISKSKNRSFPRTKTGRKKVKRRKK